MWAKKLDCLDRLLENEIERSHLGGASIIVEHKGRRIFQNCYGTDRENTIYKIFSMTKPITAVAAMMLYEQGLLDLWAPVSTYIPAFAETMVHTDKGLVRPERPIEIQDLLDMTSGIVYGSSLGKENSPEQKMLALEGEMKRRIEQGEHIDNIAIAEAMAGIPLQFSPGTRWEYGGSADILGAVIEAITKTNLGSYLKSAILDPLGMSETSFAPTEEQRARMAVMYTRDASGIVQKAEEAELNGLYAIHPLWIPPFEAGGAGLYAPIEDYVRFTRFLLDDGSDHSLLGKQTKAQLAHNHLTKKELTEDFFPWLRGYGYGNLMRVMMDPNAAYSNGSVGEFGWDGLPGNYFLVDPTNELTVVFMQQVLQGADHSLRRRIRQIIYGALA